MSIFKHGPLIMTLLTTCDIVAYFTLEYTIGGSSKVGGGGGGGGSSSSLRHLVNFPRFKLLGTISIRFETTLCA